MCFFNPEVSRFPKISIVQFIVFIIFFFFYKYETYSYFPKFRRWYSGLKNPSRLFVCVTITTSLAETKKVFQQPRNQYDYFHS